ncbi:MAG: DUF935 family protein [Deltaproteobacteria bacterium]|nr:DUF935 family protein [Deltaproteobacteria bacterium]
MPSLGSAEIDRARDAWGGQLAPPPTTKSEVYLADLEAAERAADSGDLGPAARLMRAARRDGVLSGVLSTRTDGLIQLPKKFSGADEIVRELMSQIGAVRSTFDEMFPPAELGLLTADGLLLGVGVGELRPVPGRAHPVFVRLDPEFLRYDWLTGQWFYRSIIGELLITPGDGRWILHTPGGRVAPWNAALWKAIARAFIRKENAGLAKDNYEATLANPALIAEAPNGAPEHVVENFFRRLTNAWGLNFLLGVRPGYSLKLLESSGRGHESFRATITAADTEMTVAVAGQVVTTTGGTGFANAGIHEAIRADLIQSTANALAFTINSQGLPAWVVSRWGIAALANPACVHWDVTPPADIAKRATALGQVATAVKTLREAYGDRLDAEQLAADFSIPLRALQAVTSTTPALSAGAVN